MRTETMDMPPFDFPRTTMDQTDASEVDTAIQKLAEMGLSLDTDRIPYRLEKMFPKLEGWGAKGSIKSKVKLIKQLEPALPHVLLPNEEILYVAKGIQHSLIESFSIGGLWSNMINQTVFILTNLRLLMLRTNSKGKPAETCWLIYYSEIKKFKGTITGVVDIKLSDGKRLKFTGFPKLDKKTMPLIFEEALEEFRKHDFNPECSQSRENVCARCYQIVPKNEFTCGNCGTQFWTPKQLALRSLVFPAWGDFLMRHTMLAGFEVLGIAFTWCIAISLAWEQHWAEAAMIIAFAHSIDAVVTYFIAKKGLHPVGKASRSPVPEINASD